jgi:hypothetical protein
LTTNTGIRTGVAAHIDTYVDAVALSGGGTQIFVSGIPGLREDGTPTAYYTGTTFRRARRIPPDDVLHFDSW